MSFIGLEFMGIQSQDIMADSIDTKQMLLTLSSKLGWLDGLIFANILALHFNKYRCIKAT